MTFNAVIQSSLQLICVKYYYVHERKMCTYTSLINNKYLFPTLYRISHFHSSLKRVSIKKILLNNMPSTPSEETSITSTNLTTPINRKRKYPSLDSLRVKRLSPKAKIPVRSSGQAAGYDLSR